jgi:hypothetical protein
MTDRKEVIAMHSSNLQHQLAQEHRAVQLREAAEHRLGHAARRRAAGRSVRRSVGRSLIRLGHALAPEHDPALQPARPR